MKRIVSLICMLIAISVFVSCQKNHIEGNNELEMIKIRSDMEQMPNVSMRLDDYNSFYDYLDYDNIDCPYNDLFGIDRALIEKENRSFEVQEHTYDFFVNANFVDKDRLYEIVKQNNKKYMDGVGKHFNKELSNTKLRECCEIVADTVNWGIENIKDLDLNELGCILGNLKILNRGSMSLGTFNDKKDLLNISPDMIKSKKNRNGNANMYEITVSHEAMHILQCRCIDVEQSEIDSFIGTSYSFECLDINPLKNSWLYEASAELNTTLRYECKPTTYQYMIDNLESISLATVLNDNVEARQLEKLCFIQDEETLYSQLEFKDKAKAAEFLYVVELLRNKPDDFKTAYENEYGPLKEDYSEFLKITYNPYFVEVVSKLLYKNLALKLTQEDISLNDVFYIISMYELDLLKDIPLNNQTVREKYRGMFEQYIEMRKIFFSIVQKSVDVDVMDTFSQYQMNYENDSLYANATLEWLEAEKREYILFRNSEMYDKTHRCIVD